MKVITAKKMRELEAKAQQEYGVSTLVMMENAGAEAARIILERYPVRGSVVVLAGKGNNGGDGFVVARHLLNAGVRVTTFLLAGEDQLKGDALSNWQILKKMSAQVFVLTEEEELRKLPPALFSSELVVDALLGTGFTGEVSGHFQAAIELVNSLDVEVAALDTPSGLPVDSGLARGTVMTASLTVTMGLPKLGFFHPAALDSVGELVVADIGVPAALLHDESLHVNLIEEENLPLLPPRGLNTHKKKCGRLLIIAGSENYSGAAVLTAEAALNSGTGYVTLAVPQGISRTINSHIVEAVTIPLASDMDGLSMSNRDLLLELTRDADAVVLGPGLGQGCATIALLRELVVRIEQPLIVDADGLNILAQDMGILARRKGMCLLTPHEAEFARLLGTTVTAVSEERFTLAGDFAVKYGVCLLLKGPRTLIATPKGEIYINTSGGPELATAGSGDVLSGLLGGITARMKNLLEAARLGCYWHGLSGMMAKADLGLVRAMDIADYLPRAYQLLVDEIEEGDDYAG